MCAKKKAYPGRNSPAMPGLLSCDWNISIWPGGLVNGLRFNSECNNEAMLKKKKKYHSVLISHTAALKFRLERKS